MNLLKHFVCTLTPLTLTTALCLATPAGQSLQLTSPDQEPDGLAKTEWTSIRAAYEVR